MSRDSTDQKQGEIHDIKQTRSPPGLTGAFEVPMEVILREKANDLQWKQYNLQYYTGRSTHAVSDVMLQDIGSLGLASITQGSVWHCGQMSCSV